MARSAGGALPDRLGGIRVTLVNFILMATLSGLLFLTLPIDRQDGNFMAFFTILLVLSLITGLGSGSTFQMTPMIFRKLTIDRVKAEGGSDEHAVREAATDTAAALGFISAIGMISDFLIPKVSGSSLALVGSPVGAAKIFLIFYIVCVVITWAVYGRHSKKQIITFDYPLHDIMSRFFYAPLSYNILTLYGLLRWTLLRVIDVLPVGDTP